MSSSFWLLEFESYDFSQAEEEKTACKALQIHKIFIQNGPRLLFWAKIVVIFVNLLSFPACKKFFLSQLEKNHVTQFPTAKN